MRQVSTGIKRHTQDSVAGLQQRLKHTLVGLTAGIWLHVGEAAPKQPTSPFNREIFRGNEFDFVALTAEFFGDRTEYFGIARR